jgi:hypothetical protein
MNKLMRYLDRVPFLSFTRPEAKVEGDSSLSLLALYFFLSCSSDSCIGFLDGGGRKGFFFTCSSTTAVTLVSFVFLSVGSLSSLLGQNLYIHLGGPGRAEGVVNNDYVFKFIHPNQVTN